MALNIPASRSVLPEQNATQGLDPSRTFGNQVAGPLNLPSVPRGMGGFAIDQSAEMRAIGNVAPALSEAVGGVIDSIDKKEKALQRANETLDFAESQHAYQSDWIGKKETIRKLLDEGFYDVNGANEQAQKELQGLNEKHFGVDRFRDPDIALKAKLQVLEANATYTDSFKKDVIFPYQTAKFTERINTTTNQAIDSTSTVARLSGGQEEALDAYLTNRAAIHDTYSTPEAALLLGEEKALHERAKKLQLNARAVIDGLRARDFVPDDPTKYDVIKGAQLKIKAYGDAQQLLVTNDQLRQDIGADADNVIAQLEGMKAKQIELIQRQQELLDRRREREDKTRDKARFNQALLDITTNGVNSRFKNEEAIIGLGLDPDLTVRVLDKARGVSDGELTRGQAFNYVEEAARAGKSMANPDKNGARYLEDHYFTLRTNPNFQALPPDQKAQYIAQTYGSVGWLPESLKTDILRALNSDRPEIVSDSILQIQKLEQVSPTILSALPMDSRAMYKNVSSGMSLDKAVLLRQTNQIKTPEQRKVDEQSYLSARGVKKEGEAREKNDRVLESKARSQNGWFDFGKPAIPTSMYNEFDRKVREYSPLVGHDMSKAEELAWNDVSANAGVSVINGARTLMPNAPEKVYRDMRPERLTEQFKQAIEQVKAIRPELANKKPEDFGIIADATYNKKKPEWQITVRDEDGNFWPILHPTTGKAFAYFAYDTSKDIADNEAKLKSEREKAIEDRKRLVAESEAAKKRNAAKPTNGLKAEPLNVSYDAVKPTGRSPLNSLKPSNSQ